LNNRNQLSFSAVHGVTIYFRIC